MVEKCYGVYTNKGLMLVGITKTLEEAEILRNLYAEKEVNEFKKHLKNVDPEKVPQIDEKECRKSIYIFDHNLYSEHVDYDDVKII